MDTDTLRFLIEEGGAVIESLFIVFISFVVIIGADSWGLPKWIDRGVKFVAICLVVLSTAHILFWAYNILVVSSQL